MSSDEINEAIADDAGSDHRPQPTPPKLLKCRNCGSLPALLKHVNPAPFAAKYQYMCGGAPSCMARSPCGEIPEEAAHEWNSANNVH